MTTNQALTPATELAAKNDVSFPNESDEYRRAHRRGLIAVTEQAAPPPARAALRWDHRAGEGSGSRRRLEHLAGVVGAEAVRHLLF